MANYEPPGVTGFVYLWYDRAKQMLYIGSHFGTTDDKYICSSPWMKRAYKRRPSHFMRRILHWHFSEDRQALLEREFEWLRKIPDAELGKHFYNLNGGKPGHWIAKDGSLDIKKRISAGTKAAMARSDVRANYLEAISRRDYTQTPTTREKRRQSMLAAMAKKFPDRKIYLEFGSPEYREAMSQSIKLRNQTNNPYTPEVRAKMSEANRGKKRRLGQKNTLEHNQKIAEGNLGQKRSPEAIEKMRFAKLGTKQSVETIQKRRASLMGKAWWTDGIQNKKSVECPGDGWHPGMQRLKKLK